MVKFFIVFFVLLAVVLVRPPAPSAEVSVVGGLRRHMVLSPGEEFSGRVIVRNPGAKSQSTRVYLTGYKASAGKIVYTEPGMEDRSNAAWVHLSPAEQEIPAGGNASFHYIVRVPDDETLSGTYWSMLMVHPVAPETLAPPEPETGRARVGIRTVTRTGIHLAVHIGDTGTRDLRFSNRELEIAGGRAALRLDMENTGERYLRLDTWAELFDEAGASLGRFGAGRRGLYPGNSARVRFDFSGIPPGEYQALVVADNGDEHVFGARYEIEIPAPGTAPGDEVPPGDPRTEEQ